MAELELEKHGMGVLAEYAEHLNGIDTPKATARPFYDVLVGGLVWSDETVPTTPMEVISALRPIWAYRTYVMLNRTRADAPVWTRCMELFPNWVGFCPHRREATPELLSIYRRGDISTRWFLRHAEGDGRANDK